ncbi:DUF1254 domain-containing protein [Nocardia sp. NPDC058058]|uniref:DUF1254 domain-containing protein n=1 Tax=Nocardia sp. NPDC058058 TaxID=3346317 RepID=UPI0036DB1E6D
MRWCAVLIGAAVASASMTGCGNDSNEANRAGTTGGPSASTSAAPVYPLNQPVLVTPDNFARAESDREFAISVGEVGIGNTHHIREPMPIDNQTVVRANRDTLYSSAVVDLDAGPVSITLPDAGKRFMSMQIIDEDEYVPEVVYKPGTYTYDRDKIGTRYMMVGIRTFVDPGNPADVDAVHKLQDTVTVKQASKGTFEIPQWDKPSQDKVRDALLTLASTLPDTKNSFGPRGQVDEVRHLITSASAWGGNPQKDALYLNVTPPDQSGQVNYKLNVKDVPVDGFWSVSLYNAQGYYEANPLNAYSINNVTAKKSSDGSVDIQFGGCDGQIPNCLPTMPGWNYMVRLYQPHQNVLDGTWTFPQAQPLP